MIVHESQFSIGNTFVRYFEANKFNFTEYKVNYNIFPQCICLHCFDEVSASIKSKVMMFSITNP